MFRTAKSCILGTGVIFATVAMKTAWVFPGQGSQAIGMEGDLTTQAPERWAQAHDILGWSVAEVCAQDEEKLHDTRYTQPCLYLIESLLVDMMYQHQPAPDFVAGHSLGEYVALYAAGVIDFETGLKLVQKRGELMSAAAGGKMVALIGFDRAELLAAIAAAAEVVLANDNSAAQVVISGTPEGVDRVVAGIKSKRAVPLKVSGAFHSPLMAPAAQEFQQLLAGATFAEARVPVLSNVDPTPTRDAAELRARLTAQMTGSVRWLEISEQLAALGVEKSIEVGPGKVLAGLLKRTCPTMELANVSNAAEIQA
jgi:[acyl-carrier-protein] S-malonyltransferase